jgi:thiol-disulfide isomerase/thioredoxin
MKTFLICFLFVYGLILFSFGQSTNTTVKSKTSSVVLKQLKIGNRLPDLLIPNMINYPKASMRISDLKGKYIILDFWHTTCSSCIRAFPAMQQWQKKYSKQLKIILVGSQAEDPVRKFLYNQKLNAGFDITMSIACADKQLNALFKPPTYPHFVWIDNRGIIRYITFEYDVTDEHIDAFLHDKPLVMEEKNDIYLNYEADKPLFINGNGGNESTTRACSILSTVKTKLAATTSYSSPGDSLSNIEAIGWPIKGLFQAAFNDYINGYHMPDNRTILQVRDTTKYVWYINGIPQWQNLYVYQLFVPYQSAESLKKMMQADLMRYFGLEAHMETRIMTCWVMTSGDTSLLVTKGGAEKDEMSSANFSLFMRNTPFFELECRFIYNFFERSPYPFVNKVRMNSNIDVHLERIHFDNYDEIIADFKKYGLNIRLEKHPVDILVITEPGFQSADTRSTSVKN